MTLFEMPGKCSRKFIDDTSERRTLLPKNFNIMHRLKQLSSFLKALFTLAGLYLAVSSAAQPGPTPAELRFKAFEKRRTLTQNSLLGALQPESIGPSVFSCRVTDVDVNPEDPTQFYVAYASGGLWYTESNGTEYTPLFDHEASMTIGDIAVDWRNKVIWVGTGEVNGSRSSYAGTGMYRSADGGKTWEWRGLPESHHIGRIVLHPTNPETLWVAVLGHLYTKNEERGVYRSHDGGKTWSKTLYIGENSGAVDLIIDPLDPNILYAASWQRERTAWNFSGAGPSSGLWKSIDGGLTWDDCNGKGFPVGDKIGRIGLAAGVKNGKTVLYACLDNQNSKPKKDSPAEDKLTKNQLRSMSKEDFLKLPAEKIEDFLKTNDFPKKYNGKKIKDLVEKNKITPLTLVEFTEDANNNLFETDYIGAEVYRSDDGGANWYKTHSEAIEQMHFTYGYYFSNIRCMPNDPDQVYLIGFLIIRSDDGGKTWKNINGDNVHVDHHALWLNPRRPGHLVNGNDGGINISWDNGKSWIKSNNPPVGQFYAIAVDEADPYNVYGGAQDNGVWVGPNGYKASSEWQQTGQYPYKELMGGDGMQVQVDFRNNRTVYTGFQFGNYYRIDRFSGNTTKITPSHDLGERPLRFNWQTPIHLSRHQQDVLYLGANKLYRSFNQGEDWEAISDDLTAGGKKGNVPYGTLTCIHESPKKMGLLYTGSDDGLIHVSRDGGETWKNISAGLPENYWVSRVQASSHERSRVYASLNGYRFDEFTAWLYVSENYGQTWTRLGLDLPAEPINVVREDPVNPDILYVGTDHNVYVSIDRGRQFHSLHSDFPHTPVHDLVIQAKENDLIIGTHGRSMYKVNIALLQQLTDEIKAATVHIFDIKNKKYAQSWGKKSPYKELKDPELPVWYYVKNAGKAHWSVRFKEGDVQLQSGMLECRAGLNRFDYTLDLAEGALKKYAAALNSREKDAKKPIEVGKADTGKYYLKRGSYLFSLEKDGVKIDREFTLE